MMHLQSAPPPNHRICCPFLHVTLTSRCSPRSLLHLLKVHSLRFTRPRVLNFLTFQTSHTKLCYLSASSLSYVIFQPPRNRPPPPRQFPFPLFSSLSGTITPSVVAAKREQMLEPLPTQCTKPPTAGLWILSLLLLSSSASSSTATKNTEQRHQRQLRASTSHLWQGGVDRFTYAAVCNILRGENENAVAECLCREHSSSV